VFEIDSEALDLVTFYSRNFAVPSRRDVNDTEVLLGKRLFHETGCASCHTPDYVTHRLADQPEQSFQMIWPYTDLL
ncbi:di-heme oxidoredictase family protein, partial [Shimia thalassica]|uniref:di-heme oxidoredictase family protein n=1 Tax=Shimia thalassica TaxID=1715693 RepID=UPI0026E40798